MGCPRSNACTHYGCRKKKKRKTQENERLTPREFKPSESKFKQLKMVE